MGLLAALAAGLAVAGCNGHLESKSDAAAQPAATKASDVGTSGDDGYAADDRSTDSGEDRSGEVPAGDDSGFASEGARTQSMEQQANDLEQQYQDARANARTPEQAEQAYQKFERDRAKLDANGNGTPPPR